MMRIKITTNVWHGEYDAAEFRDGHEVIKDNDYYWTVIETVDYDPAVTVIEIAAAD